MKRSRAKRLRSISVHHTTAAAAATSHPGLTLTGCTVPWVPAITALTAPEVQNRSFVSQPLEVGTLWLNLSHRDKAPVSFALHHQDAHNIKSLLSCATSTTRGVRWLGSGSTAGGDHHEEVQCHQSCSPDPRGEHQHSPVPDQPVDPPPVRLSSL